MNTTGIEVDEVIITEAIKTDSYGIIYRGINKLTEKKLLLLAIIPFKARPISIERLKSTLSLSMKVESPFVSSISSIHGCSEAQATALLELAKSALNLQALSNTPPTLIVAYDLDPLDCLATTNKELSESTQISIIENLLEGLSALHKKRIYHLSLCKHTIWISQGGSFLTHHGLFPLFRKRGLSLKSQGTNEIDQVFTHRLSYASPEELTGRLTNQASDLFAVGAIIYELFFGQLPEPNLESGYHRLLPPTHQAAWDEFFSKALSNQMRDRFPNAEVMLQTFREVVSVHPPSRPSALKPNEAMSAEVSSSEHLHQQSDATPDMSAGLMKEVESLSDNLDETFSEQMDEDEQMFLMDHTQQESIDHGSIDQFESSLTHDMTQQDDSLLPSNKISQTLEIHPNQDVPGLKTLPLNTIPQVEETQAEPNNPLPEVNDFMSKSVDPLTPTNVPEATLDRNKNEGINNIPEKPFAQTIGFFSGGSETESDKFKSLKSQLAKVQDPSPVPQQADANHLAFGASNINEMGFGGGDDFGFDQSQQDERTFLEFSDVDDKTVFEVDQDLFIQENNQLEHAQHSASPQQPPVMKTMALFSQDIDSQLPNDIKTPDFLDDLGGADDPSRVLPIPSVSGNKPVSHQKELNLPTPPQLQKAQVNIPQEQLTPVPLPPSQSGSIFSTDEIVKPSSNAPLVNRSSSLQGDALDWPGNQKPASVYTPPAKMTSPIESRPKAKIKGEKSFISRLVSLIVPLILVSVGGVGVYWVGSNWEQVSLLLATEAPQSMSLTTSPADMQVIIDNKPYQGKPPFIYRFEGAYSTGKLLPLRFLWARKIHNEKIKLPSGALSVYFLAETPSKNKKRSRLRRRKKPKALSYAQGYVDTPGESLQVLLDGQPIGQTPLLLIAPKNKSQTLKLVGPGIEKEVSISPDNTEKSRITVSFGEQKMP